MRAGSVARTVAVALATLAMSALCVRLGFWQWRSWLATEAAWTRFARGADAVQPLGARRLADVPLYQRVSLAGRLDDAHQFLLDNRSHRGNPGYEVLTPLTRDGAPALLVDRGWVPFTGSRARLPQVPVTQSAPLNLSGRVADLPSAGLASGRAAPAPGEPWPKVTSFPTPAELADALGAPLEKRILLLDPAAPAGFVRDWQPPGMSPLRHLS
ncbi:MAG TPA: SURF1 family protein, partial [Steroidobacteraceae bacterium]|nr:SURF1 family protein [Steroidobacteraceae bacterium]